MFTLGQLQRKQGHIQTLIDSLESQLRGMAADVWGAMHPNTSDITTLSRVLVRAGWIGNAFNQLDSLRQDFGVAAARVERLAERSGPLGEESTDAMFDLQRIERELNRIERAIELQADWR